jgi:nucleoside-diphosphate-sugar epimerase
MSSERAAEPGIRGQAFNISTGRPWTVLEVVAKIDEAVGVSEPPHQILGTAEAAGEIPHQTLDCSKARKRLGWTAKTDLEDGLATTVDWYRDYFDG